MSLIFPSSSSSYFFSSGSLSSGTPPRKMMSLYNLYEVTNPIDDDVTFSWKGRRLIIVVAQCILSSSSF